MQFDLLLSRADDATLQRLLGEAPMRLLMALDPGLATPARLRELVISLNSREGLLQSKESRNILFDLLPVSDAKILAQILQVNANGPYEALKRVNISRKSKREQALFDFFELIIPEPEAQEFAPALQISAATYPLFPHQRTAVAGVHHHLTSSPYRTILHMPTGAGKTRTAMNVIAEHLRQREPNLVVWLAHTEELCEQAAVEFTKAWSYLGNRDLTVYRFWGDREIQPTEIKDGIVIAGLSKLYSAAKQQIRFISQLASKTSLVVMDEAHSAIAETYQLVLEALVVQHPRTALLGLTATPGRTWADIAVDEQLAAFFARRKVTLTVPGYANPVDYLVAEQYLAEVDYCSLFYEGGLELSPADLRKIAEHLDIPPTILQQLAEDEQRNLAIITAVEHLVKSHRRILLFAATVEHANLLAAVLRARGIQAASVTGQTPTAARARIIEEYRTPGNDPRVLCNFGVLTTGFDAPQTSAAVIARPTKSLVLYSQMVGRAIRGVRAGGNARAEIVTVVDYSLPGFGSVAEAFRNWEDIWD
jgi:DNA repair protein RadD